jgi:multiple sugar transport system permease protein
LFASLWLLGFFCLTLGPMVASMLLSGSQWDGITSFSRLEWVGTENYRKLLTADPLFWKSLANTAICAFLSVPLTTLAALGLALLLNRPLRGITLFRTVFYLPSILSGVATAFVWMWLFNPSFGMVNLAIRHVAELLHVPLTEPGWLAEEAWAKPVFIIMSLWGVGNAMLIYLAGLQGMPTHLYEAAELDGATAGAQFRHVTLPALTPTIFFNLVMSIVGSFQIFTSAYVMTNGGPNNATLFYVLYLYRKAFEQFQMGYASALAWILFLIVLAMTLLVIRSSSLWVYYESERA